MATAMIMAALLAAPSVPQIVSIDPVVIGDSPVMRLTFPAEGKNLPLVILSHGNRLSRSDYQPLVAALARAGYVVVQPDHPDASTDGLPSDRPQPADSWRVRVQQIGWIAAHARDIAGSSKALKGRVDAKRIALVGHSFGGHTAALAMGAEVSGEATPPRLKSIGAAVLLAPPGHYDGLTPEWKARAPYLRTDWRPMRGPVLIVNGGEDATPMSGNGPKWHDDAFNRAKSGQDICLKVVDGAGHYLGGIDSALRPPEGDTTQARRDSVFGTVIAFLRASLGRSGDAGWAERRRGLACK